MNNRINTNIDVYLKNDQIQIRFDTLIPGSKNPDDKNVSDIFLLADLRQVANLFANEPLIKKDSGSDNEHIYNKKIIEHILQISSKELDNQDSLIGNIQDNVIEIKMSAFRQVTITYTLSTIPHIFSNWFACFSVFMNVYGLNYVQFSDYSQFEALPTLLKNSIGINDLFNQNNDRNRTVRKIMSKIIELKNTKKESLAIYQNALEDFEKIYNYYLSQRENNVPLVQCFSDKIRAKLVYENKMQTFSKMSLTDKEESILKSTLTPDDAKLKIEFLFMLELLNTRDKLELVKPCLGMPAYDENPFCMEHTELLLIYFAEFHLFEDGKFGIINLDKNPAYLQFYAPGNEKYKIMNVEFYHLAKCLNWEYDPSIDFHKSKQIIFTDNCSNELVKFGLHINSQFSKDLFNIYKLWTFMTKIRLQGDNLFSGIPLDVFDRILRETNPSYQRSFYEYQHPTFFKAVQFGKLKGLELHNEIQTRKLLSGLKI